jgi:predicted small secreted protein
MCDANYANSGVWTYPSFGAAITILLLLFSAALSSCSTINQIGAPPIEQQAKKVDAMMAAADFNVSPANSPAGKHYLENTAPLKLRYVIDPNGNFHFWLADPYHCHCVFYGDEAAYLRYAKIERDSTWAEKEEKDAEALVAVRTQLNSCLNYNMYSGMGCLRFF